MCSPWICCAQIGLFNIVVKTVTVGRLTGGIENHCRYLRPVLVISDRSEEWNGKDLQSIRPTANSPSNKLAASKYWASRYPVLPSKLLAAIC